MRAPIRGAQGRIAVQEPSRRLADQVQNGLEITRTDPIFGVKPAGAQIRFEPVSTT